MTIIRAQRTPATPSAGPTLTQTGPAAVNVTWTMPEGASTVILKRGSTTLYTGALLTYDDTTVTYPNTYGYTTQGISTGGFPGAVSPTASITISDVTAPSVPAITVTAISSGTINVTLSTASTDAGSGVLNYDVERSLNGSTGFAAIPSSPFTSLTTWPDTGLSASTAYYYRARARDVAGNTSSYSAVVNATTQAAAGGGATLTHGVNATITGSGFGSKSTPGPLVWDNCSHGQPITNRWSGYFPFTAGADSNMDYRAPGTGLVPAFSLPHSRTTKALLGRHQYADANAGWNVGMSKGIPFAEGQPVYISYVFRNSPGFYYTPADDNYKLFHWDGGAQPFATSLDGYLEYKGSDGGAPYIKCNTGGTSGWSLTDATFGTGNTSYFTNTPGNISQVWTRHEMMWGLGRTSSAFVYVVINNASTTGGPNGGLNRPNAGQMRLAGLSTSKLHFWWHGANAPPSGSTCYAQIGTYSRTLAGDTLSWRAFCDVYIDTTWSRVVVTDSATYDSSTKVIPQVCTGWNASSISFDFYQADLVSGSQGHIHVFDSSNNRQYIGARTIS